MKKFYIKYFNIIFPFLIALLYTIVWFHKSLFLGVGESGIAFFYAPNYVLNLSLHAWASPAIGNSTSITVSGMPLYTFLTFLQKIHIPGFLVQAGLFMGLMFISIVGFNILFSQYKISKAAIFLLNLFYLANPVVIVLVWNRFQYPFIFLYFLLPLCFGFFAKGIQEKKWQYIFYLGFITTAFSLAFSSIPLIELFWLLLASFIIFFLLTQKQKRRDVFWIIFFTGALLFEWIFFNAWWLFQFVNIFRATSYITSQAYTTNGDLDTFIALSQKLGNLSYVFRLLHADFFNQIGQIWGPIYTNPLIIIISFLIPVLTFFPLLIQKKPKILYYFLGLSLLVTFFAKGMNGPFGFIFLFLFSHLRFLEAFRNPFEKIGLLLPFSYAPLIGYSLYYIFEWISKKYNKKKSYIITGILCFILFVIYAFPLWNGWVFTSTNIPTNNLSIGDYVRVPEYYKNANNWLNKDKEDSREIALPIDGEGITQTWQYGYTGVELSNGLFDKPFVSFSTSIQFYEPLVAQIEPIVLKAPQYLSQLMSILGSKYILVRSDINYHLRSMTSPDLVNASLQNNQAVYHVASFGPLRFYQTRNFTPKIYAAKTIIEASKDTKFADVFSLTNFQPGDAIVNIPIPLITERSKFVVSVPTSSLDFSSYPKLSLEDAEQRMPYVRFLPGSKFYSLIRLKENIESIFITSTNDKFINLISLADKRDTEFVELAQQHKQSLIYSAEKDYIKSLDTLQSFLQNGGYGYLQDNIDYFEQNIASQRVILDNAVQGLTGGEQALLNQAKDRLQNLAMSVNMSYTFTPQVSSDFSKNRMIYEFNTASSGEYELLIKNNNWENFYYPISGTIPVQLDSKVIYVDPKIIDGWISLGNISLTQGTHEIQLKTPKTINLLNGKDTDIKFSLEGNSIVKKELPIKDIDPYSTYRISFDYYIEKGDTGIVSLVAKQDNSEKLIWKNGIGEDGYTHAFQNRNFIVSPAKNTELQNLVFSSIPYNTCYQLNGASLFRLNQCKTNKAFYNQFNKTTILHIRNLRVEKIFTNVVALRLIKTVIPSKVPTITFKKINAAKYIVSVKNATSPYLLIFSEAFHPLWRAEFMDTKNVISDKNHLLANSYANGWYVTRKGSYNIVLEFLPEKVLIIGEWVSAISISLAFVILVIFFIRKKWYE